MGKIRVAAVGMSLDGFIAGPNQSEAHPLGVGGEAVLAWAMRTRSFKAMIGEPGGSTGTDSNMFAAGFEHVGSWVMGRNMFGPDRGVWRQALWRGWWGESPPFYAPVFILTQHPRDDLVTDDGTRFQFVTDGAEAALSELLKPRMGGTCASAAAVTLYGSS